MIYFFGMNDRTFLSEGEEVRQVPGVRSDRMLRKIPMAVKVGQKSVYKVLHSCIIGRLDGFLYERSNIVKLRHSVSIQFSAEIRAGPLFRG